MAQSIGSMSAVLTNRGQLLNAGNSLEVEGLRFGFDTAQAVANKVAYPPNVG